MDDERRQRRPGDDRDDRDQGRLDAVHRRDLERAGAARPQKREFITLGVHKEGRQRDGVVQHQQQYEDPDDRHRRPAEERPYVELPDHAIQLCAHPVVLDLYAPLAQEQFHVRQRPVCVPGVKGVRVHRDEKPIAGTHVREERAEGIQVGVSGRDEHSRRRSRLDAKSEEIIPDLPERISRIDPFVDPRHQRRRAWGGGYPRGRHRVRHIQRQIEFDRVRTRHHHLDHE